MQEILFLKPVLKECVWGGQRLVTEFPYQAEGEHIGECWAISAHPHGDCVIAEGAYRGMTLSQLYGEHRELFGGICAEQFPLLVKIIDARENLSIQVHPDDAYVKTHENCPFGKTECWYVMDCPENASLIIGHHARTRDELKEMIAAGRYEELIREVPVKKGDFLQIVPGTVHAIKGGFLILETQQNSDITYRVYDYDRLVDGKPRQLHVQQSIDVINVPDEADKKALSHAGKLPENQLKLLVECDYYRVWKLNLKGEFALRQKYPFLIASVLEGSGSVDGRKVEKGTHFLLPAGYGTAELSGEMELILSTVPGQDEAE
ncbi:MAG: mannose-6-phosphate isomerase, class I [Acetatifactor sp.]